MFILVRVFSLSFAGSHDPPQRIFEFLSVHFFESGDEIRNFAVSTHFPKMDVTDLSQTIESLVRKLTILLAVLL